MPIALVTTIASRPLLGGLLSLSDRLPARPSRDRVLELVLFAGVILLSALTPARSTTGAPNAPGMETLDRVTGGGLCPFRRVTGIDCGGCGLTRGFVAMAHGDVETAVRLNPFTPIVFAWFAWRAVELIVLLAAWRELRIGISSDWKWRFYGSLALGFAILAAVRVGLAITAR